MVYRAKFNARNETAEIPNSGRDSGLTGLTALSLHTRTWQRLRIQGEDYVFYEPLSFF